jgi:sugar phosphate isomerase/epimerase
VENEQTTRRRFVARSSAGVLLGASLWSQASASTVGVDWPMGCFNRPWGRWTYDEALDGMRTAGFTLTGLLGAHRDEPFLMPEATGAYLEALRGRIQARGLSVIVAGLHLPRGQSLAAAKAIIRAQIDHARPLGVKYMLSMGEDHPAMYEQYYRVMRDAAAYAADFGMNVVIKPHGGLSASAAEILRCVDRVSHANFRVWYDAGNIVHYTGLDPVADVA